MSLIDEAKRFAKAKHGQQRRKCGNKPYISHPQAVAERLKQLDGPKVDEDVVAAAYLHDTLEDTDATLEELRSLFNDHVANLVKEVTSNEAEYQNDEDKLAKGKYLAKKMNKMTHDALLIKLADREHNVSDLKECSASFRKRYARETQFILKHLDLRSDALMNVLIESIKQFIKPYL